ncbi:hypothetical protein D3C71_862230 [compost metagenome]
MFPLPTVKRAPGTPCNSARMEFSIEVWSMRSSRGVNVTSSAPRRTSPPCRSSLSPCPAPTVDRTPLMPGNEARRARAASATVRVSRNALPGGNSTLTVVYPRSDAGIKPVGKSGTRAKDATRKAKVKAIVDLRCAKHQLANRKYPRIKRPSETASAVPLFGTCGFSRYTAIMGVISRATSKEARTATTAVHPNSLKNSPGTPPISAVGRKTTTSATVVAITASAISVTASAVATSMGFPIRAWRSIFSTSTMASSTRMPTITASASRLTVFSVKPNHAIAAKVGMMESGKADAATSMARQSRRNSHTTKTARIAPS